MGDQQGVPNAPTAMPRVPSAQQYVEGAPGPAEQSFQPAYSLRALQAAYNTFEKAEAAAQYLDKLTRGEVPAPIVKLSIPTGGTDRDGQQIVLDVDIMDMVRKLTKSPDEAVRLTAQIFTPFRVYMTYLRAQAVSRLVQQASLASNQ